jgi:hypothetical protein
MSIDFSKINDKIVGYILEQPHNYIGLAILKQLKFKDFIVPYYISTENYQEVLDNLRNNLEGRISQQESYVAKTEGRAPIEIIAILALERELIINAMQLIKDNYLK